MDNEDVYKILNQNNKYHNDPELIKLLIEKMGTEGHKKIHINLLNNLINKYADLNIELQKKIKEITRMSETDQLTQIHNRQKFIIELEKEINRVERYQNKLSLIMLDIDHFKRVNDTFGHDIGDMVLVKTVNIIEKIIRETDIFARWGGEEFMILLPHTNINSAEVLAERIRQSIENYSFERVKNVTCSFGVADFFKNESYDFFIKQVDNALYEAKNNGRNRVICAR